MKFSIKEFFNKCDQIRRKLRIWSHLLKESLMENLIVCAGKYLQDLVGVIGIVWLSETGQPQHPSVIMKRLRLTYWHNINREVSLKSFCISQAFVFESISVVVDENYCCRNNKFLMVDIFILQWVYMRKFDIYVIKLRIANYEQKFACCC